MNASPMLHPMEFSSVVDPQAVNEKHKDHGLPETIVKAHQLIIEYLGRDNDLTDAEKANFADTAVRAAKAFASMTSTRTQINEALKEILAVGFPKDTPQDVGEKTKSGLITQGPIRINSLCPHHLLHVEYEAWVAYQPVKGGAVLGLSKLARVAKELGRRPVLQEQLASDIADVLCVPKTGSTFYGIVSDGSVVTLNGRHSCMSCRGVHSDALTNTTEVRSYTYPTEDLERVFWTAVNSLSNSGLRR